VSDATTANADRIRREARAASEGYKRGAVTYREAVERSLHLSAQLAAEAAISQGLRLVDRERCGGGRPR